MLCCSGQWRIAASRLAVVRASAILGAATASSLIPDHASTSCAIVRVACMWCLPLPSNGRQVWSERWRYREMFAASELTGTTKVVIAAPTLEIRVASAASLARTGRLSASVGSSTSLTSYRHHRSSHDVAVICANNVAESDGPSPTMPTKLGGGIGISRYVGFHRCRQ